MYLVLIITPLIFLIVLFAVGYFGLKLLLERQKDISNDWASRVLTWMVSAKIITAGQDRLVFSDELKEFRIHFFARIKVFSILSDIVILFPKFSYF